VQFDRSHPAGELRRTLDISKASTEIGYAPQTSLEEGLRRTIEWYRGTSV
jgi:nucleoside-diphosphate-sugar epimerase